MRIPFRCICCFAHESADARVLAVREVSRPINAISPASECPILLHEIRLYVMQARRERFVLDDAVQRDYYVSETNRDRGSWVERYRHRQSAAMRSCICSTIRKRMIADDADHTHPTFLSKTTRNNAATGGRASASPSIFGGVRDSKSQQ